MMQAITDLTIQPIYNQITFVGNDGNLWLVSPDGSNLRQVTNDSKDYVFPTWSPDGRHLAFVGPYQQKNMALYVSPTNEVAPMIVYDDPASSPFYLYWAPDSQTITFLAQERPSMAMRQTGIGGSARLLGEGAPFYWVWSPKSDKLLLHVGGDRTASEQAHISIVENGEETVRIELNVDPGRFQAPVWSTDGSYFYYVAENSNGVEFIYKTNADTLEQQPLTPVSGVAFLTLSPDNRHLAYLQIERNNGVPFGSAYIINTDGTQLRLLTDRFVGSMYWSPDGSKLAVLTADIDQESKPTAKAAGLASPLNQQVTFRWWIYHLDTKKFESLISFSPTSDFFQTVPFFDQYHLSLTFWSPDSRYFVVTKRSDQELEDGTVWVVDTTGQEEPRQIGEGRLAVWSWR
jgi:Tol biopolymer transport system component